MKKRHIILILVACALMLFGGMAIWITHDEEPLDYSAMDIEIGPRDPHINGYTRLQEIAESISFDLGVIDDGRDNGEWPDLSPFAILDRRLTEAEMREIVDHNRAHFAVIDEAFALEHFQVDAEPNVETIIPHIGHIMDYVKVRCLEARLLAMDGDPEAALRLLIKVDLKIARLTEGGGSLVTFLTGVACANIASDTLAYVISHYELPGDTLRQAMQDYPLRGVFVGHFDTAMKFEFHFAMNALDDLEENPGGLAGVSDEIPSNLIYIAYKPNMTRNAFYRQYHQIVANNYLPHNDRPVVHLTKPPMHEMILSGNAVGEILLQLLVPAMTTVLEKAVLADTESEFIYLMMAVRRHQLKHDDFPPSLEALVPDYIDAVPLDPFDGKPIRYHEKSAILYAVGLDGLDDGGSLAPSRFDRDHPDYEDFMMFDEVAEEDEEDPTFHLRFDLEPPAPPVSTAPESN